MVKERMNMYNGVFLLLITLFAVITGMVGNQAMTIVHDPNTVEGFKLKGMMDTARATKNRAIRKARKMVGGVESFTTTQMNGILNLAGLSEKNTKDDSDDDEL
jgi:hypothetical protein